MNNEIKDHKLIVIVGPTASGKSDFALKLAKAINGEIISADSRQIYREINLGTGKPTPAMQQQIPHHLLSVNFLDNIVTADQFAQKAFDIYQEIRKKNKYCLVVGGSGLWIQALIDGLAPLPGADETFRKQMKHVRQNKGIQALYEQLKKLDPTSAEKIGAGDETRLIRALEIVHLTGKKASLCRQTKNNRPALPAIWFEIDRPREELYQRCEKNIDHWISQGWTQEVEELTGNYHGRLDSPALKAIGITTITSYMSNKISLKRCIELIKRDTRRYIKKQITWFKKNQRIIRIKPWELDLAIAHIKSIENEKS